MQITGKAHCLFEQSGTFKKEFIKLGIPAEDYDIQNNFGETNHVVDIFADIEKAYDNLTRQDKTRQDKTLFDEIDPCKDLVLAFFPCIYFETMSCMCFSCDTINNRHKPTYERIADAIDRLQKRTYFHELLYKLCYIATYKKIRLIIENPASVPNYLLYTQNFFKPTIIDKNRMERGDYFKKPTAYWFFNFKPTQGFTHQNDKVQKIINDCKKAPKAGLCSEERSLISSDYARNFICDFIIGKYQPEISGQSLFDSDYMSDLISCNGA